MPVCACWPAFEMLKSSVLERFICKKTGVTSIEVIKVRTLEMKGTKNLLNSEGDLSNISHKIICRLQHHGHPLVSRHSA